MALSPNYNWSEPDNSSLVKDGALSMRTLGDAIDTSVWNVGYGQAGKNKLINGGMQVWQRGTSFAASTAIADRWRSDGVAGTWARESTVIPSNSVYSLKITASASGFAYTGQAIETLNAVALAGTNATFSAYVASNVSLTTYVLVQYSTSTDNAYAGTWTDCTAIGSTSIVTTSTTFSRLSGVFTIPSTAKSLRVLIYTGAMVSGNIVYYGNLMLEAGSKATPFQTASGGSIQGEFAMCQRYYWRTTASDVYTFFNFGVATSTVRTDHYFQFPVRMRTKPTAIESANLYVSDSAGGNSTAGALIFNQGNSDGYGTYQASSSGLTQFRPMFLESNNTTAAYVAFSAEL
jgi:hypothetical protein